MSGGVQYYRGYRLIMANRKGYIAVTFNYRSVNFHLPRKFKWMWDAGIDDLHRYIDLLILKRKFDASKYEEKGYAYDHEYEEQPEKVDIVNLSPEMLVSICLGELPLEVPIHTMLQFRGDKKGGKFIPSRVPAELANAGLLDAYYEGLREFVRSGRPFTLREKLRGVVDKKGKAADGYFPAASLIEAEKQGIGEYADREPPTQFEMAPPNEKTISIEAHGPAVDMVTIAELEGQRPYFIRRVIIHNQTVWSATSWYVDREWTTTSGSPAILSELGIAA